MTNIKNYAFIDGQNLYLQIQKSNWKIDYKRFRIYLKDKYNVEVAYLFIGYIPENRDLYNYLQKSGYVLVFKEILKYKDGRIKGNVDAELVLQAVVEKEEYDKAIIISGDGDFGCLVTYLRKIDKLETLLVPDEFSYSCLLKKAAGNKINFINRLQNKVGTKKEPQ